MTFSYDDVRDRLITTLQSKSSWANLLPYSTNRRLIDTVASGISELATYDEYLTRETKWNLSQNISSLMTNSKFLGYDANRKIGSTGTIKVSTDSSFAAPPSKNVVIPKYSQFSNGGDVVFSATADTILTTADNSVEVSVVQGIPITNILVASGDVYEETDVDDDYFENSNYTVDINSVEWTEISDLNDAVYTSQVYTIKNKIDFSGVDIQFGNDIFGVKLNNGDQITITYIQTLGISGNITSASIVTTVVSDIYDIDSDSVALYCTNDSTLDGGQDEDTLEELRTEAINTFQSGDSAVSRGDYEVKFKEKTYVQNAVIWGAYEYNIVNDNDPWDFIANEQNVVHVSAYTPAGITVTSSQQEELILYVNDDKPPEDIIQFTDVGFISMAFNVDAFILDTSYVPADVRTAIITAIEAEFALTNKDFYVNIYDSTWKDIITSVEGVNYHNSYIQLVRTADSFTSAYEASYTLDIYDIKTSSVNIYVDDVLIGVDNGSNGFTAETGYVLTGSEINYDTGLLTLVVVSGLTGDYTTKVIKTYYRSLDSNGEENLELKEINQIFKILEVTNIVVDYTT